MAGKQQYKAEELIEAARKTGGNKAAAARLLGCTRQTVDLYCNRYVTVKQAFDDERETMVDWAESGLRDAVITTKAPWAIKFILRTLGKDRGYTERVEQEITGADGGPLTVHYTGNVDPDDV